MCETAIPEMRSFMQVREMNDCISVPPYSPRQMKVAYNYNFNETGRGNIIAIVVAYGNPNIRENLKVFNERFNLPPADLEILYPQGLPTIVEPRWAIETSLDVQWAHAMAPDAKILLVVATDPSNEKLFGAVETAVNFGADIVSLSWGNVEFQGQLEYDELFKNSNVVFVAASGDQSSVIYPAISPYVIGVGGTSLQLNACGIRLQDETGWVNSGGGISEFERKPQYQYITNNAVPQTDMRTSPDISYFGDPFPGVSVYIKLNEEGIWLPVAGTSLSAPCFAGIMACALPPNTRVKNAPALIYSASNICNTDLVQAYRDITNGNTPYYPCIEGYDYVTGLGSPDITSFIDVIRGLLREDFN